MPTRKELIEQARADQRQRSLIARIDNPKSAIVGIGKRDPLTGLHDVLLPDGSVETGGERQFNSAIPEGSQVLGIPKESGGWQLDERDVVVSPIAPDIEEPKGIILWLDCNWLFQATPAVKASGFKLLEAMIQYFRTKKIYTLPTDDDRIFDEGSAVYSLDDPVIAGLLEEKGITVVRTPIAQAQGLFFMPLFGQVNRAGLTIPTPTEAEFSALRRLAKRYGVLICGEYLSWLEYDRALLRGFKLPERITIAGDTLDQNDYKVVGRGFPKLTLTGNAQGFFGGLKPSEKLVINQQENTVFAFFRIL